MATTTKAKPAAKKSPASKTAQEKRADGLAEAFPGSQPDPGPDPRPAPELSKEQKQHRDDVREQQIDAQHENLINVPPVDVVEVLGHAVPKNADADREVVALLFSSLPSEVTLSVEGKTVLFDREEFHQLQRAVGRIAGSL